MSDQSPVDEGGSPINNDGGGAYRHGQWRDTTDATPVIHPAYSDENDSLVIQTVDDVLFKVHSYYLKAASTFFRGVPAKTDIINTPNTDTTVHIEAHSGPFKILLDIVTGAYLEGRSDLQAILQALEVGKQYGFTHLPQVALPILCDQAKMDPWGVFVFAAKNDIPALAACAIDKLQFSPEFKPMSILDFDYSLLDSIPSRYAGPLVRNMTLFRTLDGETDWTRVSRNFPDLEEVSLSKIPD